MGRTSFSSPFLGTSKHAASRPVEAGVLAKGLDLFWTWQARHRSRADLMGLPDAMLKDIGLSRGEAEFEYEKPFWRG